jgi:cysteinyl-tRNA synthetase
LVAAVRELAGVLGLALGGDEAAVPDEVAALVRRRDEARGARNWAAADAARDELVTAGWLVEDTPAGTRVRRA